MTKLTTNLLVIGLACASVGTQAQDWRAGADAQIRALRTAPLRIELTGAGAAGTLVEVRQLSTDFVWGTTVNIQRSLNLEGNGTPVGGDDPYYLHLLDFNSVTPENAGKWKFWERPNLRQHYGEVAAWLRTQGVRNRGHGTIWPSIRRWNAVPDDVRALRDSLNGAGQVVMTKNDRIRARVRAHIESYVRTMAQWGVYELDLVNELVHEGDLTTDVMGLNRQQSIAEYAQWYKWAAAAAPEVRLVANEYDLYQSGNDFYRDFTGFVQGMIDLGAPVSAVGMQGHFFGAVPDYAQLRRRLDEVAALGLPMSVTEFDMDGNDAAAMERVLYSVFAHPNVYGFTIWGAWDGQQWRGNAPIYNEDWSRKPSGDKYFALVKDRWRTDTTLVYEAPVIMRAYLGRQIITVRTKDGLILREVDVTSGGQTVKIDMASAKVQAPDAKLKTGITASIVLANQPVRLSVSSSLPVKRVQYFVDGQRVATRATLDSAYSFRVRSRGELVVRAEVEFANGSVQLLGPLRYTVDATNGAPQIRRVLPTSSTVYAQRDGIRIQVEASDPNGDKLLARLLTRSGELIAVDSVAPYSFSLDGAPVGQNDYRIVVEDDRFGQASIHYQIIVVDDTRQATTRSAPLGASDDIEENTQGGIDLEGDLDIGQRFVGIRFFPRVPKGAVVSEAAIQFVNQKDSQTGSMAVGIRADARANPPALTGAQRGLTTRPLTQANVPWEIIDPWLGYGDAGPEQLTPDLAPVINELVAADGFSESSPVIILVSTDVTGAKRSAFSVDQSPILAPELRVSYKAPNPSDARVVAAEFTRTHSDGGGLTWSLTTGPTADRIFEVYLDDATEPVIVVGNTLVLEGLVPQREYTARIALLDELGAPTTPLVFSFRFGTVGVVDRLSGVGALGIHPSPATASIHLHAELSGVATITDAVGRIVAQSSVEVSGGGGADLNVATLAPGVYYVTLRNGAEVRVGSFVKQ